MDAITKVAKQRLSVLITVTVHFILKSPLSKEKYRPWDSRNETLLPWLCRRRAAA